MDHFVVLSKEQFLYLLAFDIQYVLNSLFDATDDLRLGHSCVVIAIPLL